MRNLPTSLIAAYGFLGFSLSMISFFMLDETIYHLVLSADEGNRHIWDIITDLGDSAWMGIATVAAWLLGMAMMRVQPDNTVWQKLPRQSIYVFAAVAISGIIVLIVKGIVGRARPYLFDTEGPFGFNPLSFESIYASWPSGHTTTAFAFAAALILLFPRTKILMLAFAVLAGYSRMALGAHYFADVIMGATLGTLSAIVVYQWLAPKLKL